MLPGEPQGGARRNKGAQQKATLRGRQRGPPRHAGSHALAAGRREGAGTSLPAPSSQVHDRVDDDPQVNPWRPVRDVQVVDLDHLRERHARGSERLPATRDPGVRCRRRRSKPVTRRSSSITSGRGPTMLMLPPRTLKNCGSSSRPRRRSQRPMRVTRGSVSILKRPSSASLRSRRPSLERVGAVDHAAKFEHPKWPVVAAHARLPEQHGAARIELDRDRDQRHERRDQDEDGARSGDVEGALEDQGRAVQPEPRHAHQHEAADVVERDRAADGAEHRRDQAHLQTARVREAHGLERAVGPGRVGVDDHAVNASRSPSPAAARGRPRCPRRRGGVRARRGDDLEPCPRGARRRSAARSPCSARWREQAADEARDRTGDGQAGRSAAPTSPAGSPSSERRSRRSGGRAIRAARTSWRGSGAR